MNLIDTKKFLEKNNIPFELINHSDSGLTSVQASNATNTPIQNIIKCLCFVEKNKKCFVIIQGDKKVNVKKIPLMKKPRLAFKEELLNWFNAEPGAIPPINLPKEIPKYIDSSVLKLDFVIGSAGSKFLGLKINPKYLVKQENVLVLDLGLE